MVDETRQYRVVGRVQGVGFRWWTREIAGEFDVTGTVRNCADGSVVVVARANLAALDRLEGALARGPAAARVDRVEREPVTAEVSGVEFRILVDRSGR